MPATRTTTRTRRDLGLTDKFHAPKLSGMSALDAFAGRCMLSTIFLIGLFARRAVSLGITFQVEPAVVEEEEEEEDDIFIRTMDYG